MSYGAPYILKIYDKTGKNVVKEININNQNAADSYELTGLNNMLLSLKLQD